LRKRAEKRPVKKTTVPRIICMVVAVVMVRPTYMMHVALISNIAGSAHTLVL